MADVQPFRAVRYSGAAGRLDDLVAPPYDAVSPAERARLYARSPYNVLRVTLPDSVESARALYERWAREGILERDAEPAVWLLVERFVGPDGVTRERRGVVVSLAADAYEAGHVLPHERTHPRIREERLRLLRAIGVQPEPIFVLAESKLDLATPDRPADVSVNGSSLWRIERPELPGLREEAVLIADGHHRYESAVELGAELAGGVRIMALVVPTGDPGLHVFPTHRVFSSRPDLADLREGAECTSLEEALGRLADEPYGRSAAVAYRRGRVELVTGADCELDVVLVDRHGFEGIAYTPQRAEAVAAVDGGTADAAYLLRDPRVEDVFAAARRGERMPPKSTYFFPKPLAGMLFHPVAD